MNVMFTKGQTDWPMGSLVGTAFTKPKARSTRLYHTKKEERCPLLSPCKDENFCGIVEKSKNFFAKEKGNILACIASSYFMGRGYPFELGNKILQTTGICPSALLPSWITPFFEQYINYPQLIQLKVTSQTQIISVVKIGLFEELVDRVILQDCLLKKLPKKLLQKYSPQHAHLTNHLAARVSRVLISSFYFALHHSWAHDGKDGDIYPYIIGGAILGSFQETTDHFIYNSIVHAAANTLAAIYPTGPN